VNPWPEVTMRAVAESMTLAPFRVKLFRPSRASEMRDWSGVSTPGAMASSCRSTGPPAADRDRRRERAAERLAVGANQKRLAATSMLC